MNESAPAAAALQELLHFLRERHARVTAVEAEALQRLDAGDTPGHNEKMREKAELLAALAKDAQALSAGLPGQLRFNVAFELDRFSQNARTALRIGSVFYMSALLYPDDHKPGQADNLLLCIERLAREGEDFRPV